MLTVLDSFKLSCPNQIPERPASEYLSHSRHSTHESILCSACSSARIQRMPGQFRIQPKNTTEPQGARPRDSVVRSFVR